jgi:vacuolar-type H+-ATPase subunit C/Vma6
VRILFEVPDVLPEVNYSEGMFGRFGYDAAGKVRRLRVSGFREYFFRFLRAAGYDQGDIRAYLQAGLTHAGYLSSWRDVSIYIES